MKKKSVEIIFSVITVSYNACETIEVTLKSVAAQNYPWIEYIVIDGGSTDGTREIIEKYSSSITTFVSERDGGIYDAMNKGIKLATGDYLCFINAGDSFYRENTLEKIVQGMRGIHLNSLPDIIYGETALVNSKREFVKMRRLSAPENLSWKTFKEGMLVCHQAFYPKREKVPLYDLNYKFSADYDWCIKILAQSESVYHAEMTLVNYLNEGVTTKNRWKSLLERFRIMQKHYGLGITLLQHMWFVIRLLFK